MTLNITMTTSQRQQIIFKKSNDHLPVHRFSLSVVMSAVYGYDISARDDPLVQIVVKALIPGTAVLTPERALMLKTFPFCELNSP